MATTTDLPDLDPRRSSRRSAPSSTPSASGCSTTSASATSPTSAASSGPSGASRPPAAASLFVGFLPPAWLAGAAPCRCRRSSTTWRSATTSCTASTTGPATRRCSSTTFEWDTSARPTSGATRTTTCTTRYTNVLGKDRDVGYGAAPHRRGPARGRPVDLGNPLYAAAARPAVRVGRRRCTTSRSATSTIGTPSARRDAAPGPVGGHARSAARSLKDYVLWPLLTGPSAPLTLAGNAHRQRGAQRVDLHRSSSAATSPTASARFTRRGGRATRPAATGTSASCSARPTSPAARCSTS